MAYRVYNAALGKILTAYLVTGADIRVALLMTNTTADTDNDGIVFITDFGTLDECDGANYSRAALSGETVSVDDPNDRAEFTGGDVTFAALGNGTRAIQGYLVYKHIGADSANIPIFFNAFAVNQNPGGSDFIITWNAEGILQAAQA